MFDVAVLIFLVTDPFDNIAVFLAAPKGIVPGRRSRVALRELALVLGLLLLSLTLDEHILSGLGSSREATGIMGGITLFMIAMRPIFPSLQGLLGEASDDKSPLILLVTPVAAGPSALAMLIALRITFDGPLWEPYLAMVPAWAATTLTLLQAVSLQRLLDPCGLIVIEHSVGIPLIMLSADILLDNLHSVLHAAA